MRARAEPPREATAGVAASGGRRSVVAGAAALGAVAVYEAWTQLGWGGAGTASAVGNLAQPVAAAVAAVSCYFAGRRAESRTRTGWRLYSLSAAALALGGFTWFGLATLGRQLPFPSVADIAYLAAFPLAVGALYTLPSGPPNWLTRARLLVDSTVVAAALVLIVWVLGLNEVYTHSKLNGQASLFAMVYPATDVVLVLILASSIARVNRPFATTLSMALAASLLVLASDAAFAILTLDGSYKAGGSATDAGWVAGYLLIALAAFGARTKPVLRHKREMTLQWELFVPWIAVAIGIAVGFYYTLLVRLPDFTIIVMAVVMTSLFALSEAVVLYESRVLLARSLRAEARLRDQTTLMNQLMAHAPMGIARVGPDLRFRYVNPRLCEMLAIPEGSLVGSLLPHLSSPEAKAAAFERLSRMQMRRSNDVEFNEGPIRRGDGTEIWVHRAMTPVRGADGEVDHVIAMYEDVTARHQAEQATLANLAASERLNQLKSDFVSMVSHEFRTALTGIQGYSELLHTDEVTPEEVREFSGDIMSEAARLNRMITEMLDLDRVESGRIALHVKSLDLNILVAHCVDQARTTTSRHRITMQLASPLPFVEGDPDLLVQVVTNLLSNAIKYSPGGGDIEVSSFAADAAVGVSVKDHGQGIPPEFTQKIFGRFERYEGAGKPQVVGTGLGLAISQQIVRLHKGRIWVDSTLGEGSDFRFTIPLPAGVTAPAPPAAVVERARVA